MLRVKRLMLYVVPLITIVVVLFIVLSPQRHWENEPLHSTMEAVEALSVLLMAFFMLGRKREEAEYKLILPAVGFLSMGILNSFHAASWPGDQFVFLRIVGSLAGGLGFVLVWLPVSYRPALYGKKQLWLVATGSLVVGCWAFLFPEAAPVMMRNEAFTTTAVAINLIGSIFFIAGAGRFMLDFYHSGEPRDYLFFLIGLFFGLAGLTFKYSMLWSEEWWFWHVLRLMASLLVLGFLVQQHLQTLRDLEVSLIARKRSEEALLQSTAILRAVTETTPDLVYVKDRESRMLLANPATLEVIGKGPEEVIGRSDIEILGEEAGRLLLENDVKVIESGMPQVIEEMPHPEKGRVFLSTKCPYRDETGAIIGLIGISRDITERKRIESRLTESQANLRTILDSVYDAIFIHDLDGTIIDVNRKMLELYAVDRDQALHFTIKDDYSASDNPVEKLPTIWKSVLAGEDQIFEWKAKRPLDGSIFDVEVFLRRVNFKAKDVILASVRDITERKRMEDEIRHMAHHDALTCLPNRRLFIDIAHFELAQARRSLKKSAILFLDLDRFKEVNDTLGHEAGDNLLKAVAERLKATLRESDTIARIGGDEFNIILAGITSIEDITNAVRKIMDSFQRSYLIAGHELFITTSIGISVFPEDGEDMDTLLKYADIALYYAKEHGKNNYQFYNPAINMQSIERIQFENSLRQTIEHGGLMLYYQPQVDITTRRIVCAEALIRWQHPERGLLEPKHFIPIAEETGLVTALDEWVLRTACSQFKAWRDKGMPPSCVTVNFSARHFQNPELVATVSHVLDETGLPPDCLDIEITENTVMSNIERTAERLKELAKMGIHISIDDFGTGCSSLKYLKRLPVQSLKIDQSFINELTTYPDDRAIISAVTAMAHAMKMSVIAVGVETEDQLSFLHAARCDAAQGFLFSRALPSEEFGELIAAGNWHYTTNTPQ